MGHFSADGIFFKRLLYCRIKCPASGNSIRDSELLKWLHKIWRLGKERPVGFQPSLRTKLLSVKESEKSWSQTDGGGDLPCRLVQFLVEPGRHLRLRRAEPLPWKGGFTKETFGSDLKLLSLSAQRNPAVEAGHIRSSWSKKHHELFLSHIVICFQPRL